MKRRSRRRRRSANVDSPDTTGASRLNGTYTFTATVKAFNDVGIPDQAFIDLNAGHYTVTMKDGRLQRTQRYTSGPRAGDGDRLRHLHAGKRHPDLPLVHQPTDFTEAKVTGAIRRLPKV